MSTFPLSALLIGLWSTGHCLAMCGGLAMAAGQANRRQCNASTSQRGMVLAGWQLGRVLSYTVMGLMAGAFGAFFLTQAPVVLIRQTAFVMANLMLIALGLHVAQLWSGITQLERIGQIIWRWVQPLATATLVPRTPGHPRPIQETLRALRAGAIWGWLPCGLVYSMLVTASVSGSAINGALWMLAFGLGTMPALWMTSMASHRFTDQFRKSVVRTTAGLLIVAFGLWGLLRAIGLIQIDWFDAFCIGGGSFTPS